MPDPSPAPAANTVTVSLRIENTYVDDGSEVVTTFTDVVVPAPPPGIDPADLYPWADDHLYAYTGTDRPQGDVTYDLTITSATDQQLIDARFEWGY